MSDPATAHAIELDDDEREAVYLLGEALIPEHRSGPSADQAGVPAMFIDEVLALRSDLVPSFRALLARSKGQDPLKFCRTLETEEPGAFQQLTFVIAGAYLMSPKARTWLSYEGQQGEPQDGSPQVEYGPDGLLGVVHARGPIYRPTEQGTQP